MATVPNVCLHDKMAVRGLYTQLHISQFPSINLDYLFTELHILNCYSTILFISARNRMKFKHYRAQMFENVMKQELDETRTNTCSK